MPRLGIPGARMRSIRLLPGMAAALHGFINPRHKGELRLLPEDFAPGECGTNRRHERTESKHCPRRPRCTRSKRCFMSPEVDRKPIGLTENGHPPSDDCEERE